MNAALNSPLFPAVLLAADFAITLFHAYQEWKGAGAPLWRNFGAIVGLDIPDSWGFAIFTAGLTLLLLAAAFVGIFGLIGPRATAFALGTLIGARLSDTVVSHLLPYAVGYRPNPGLSSTPLFVLEALFLAWAFQARLATAPDWAIGGLAFGALLLVAVLPGLRLIHGICPGCRRPPWQRWQSIPAWAATNP